MKSSLLCCASVIVVLVIFYFQISIGLLIIYIKYFLEKNKFYTTSSTVLKYSPNENEHF
jgi:hypothetical protein